MAMGLEIILPVVTEIITDPIKNSIACFKRHICYAFKYHSYVEKLQDEATELENKRVRLQHSVDEASRNGKKIYDNVTQWLTNADNTIVEAKKLIDGEEQTKQKRCFIGLCPNLKTQYQLSKKAEVKAFAIDKLKNEQQLDSVYFSAPPKQILAPSVFSREDLQSRVSILKEVMDALKGSNLNMIGVYGMGGVGKTTLAKEVHRQAQIDKLFDIVVMVVVSSSPEIRKIQKEIAEVLGLDLQEEGMLLRANKLYERLKNEKKILIILDDVWKQLQLEEIGIPFGDDHKGCKILLTSRRSDVCCAMGANKNFGVEVLSDGEAWSLFEMTVADGKDQSKLPRIATEVAKRCSGLPLLILIVATDLRNKEPDAWDDRLRQLSAFDNEDIQEKAHSVLQSSYDNLPNNQVKSFFLLCGLFGQSNIQIQHLVEFSIGLGLFKHITSVEYGRKRVDRLIRDLKAECLLLDGDMDGFVKMHDVVRDTAMSIASKVQHAIIGISGFEVREWPAVEDCTRISLPYCDIEELPEVLDYPNVEILALLTEDFSLKIPNSFFERIRKLRVLDLTGMYLASLPSSLDFLANIHTLRLYRCQLKDIGIIGELKQLEVLSFAESYIVELPRQIEQLTRLKLLDLSNCSKLEVIPENVLSKLSMLEELYMSNSFVQWEVEGNASLSELEELSHLSILELKIVAAKVIPKNLFFSGLRRYRILIGAEWKWWHGNYKTSKTLKLKLLTSSHLEQGVKVLLKESEDLHLDEVRGIETVLSDVNSEGFPRLKNLHIQNDPVIQHIINSTKCGEHHAFPILESLFLNNLRSLKQMCYGQLVSGSFSKLTNLKVVRCHSLTHLFSFSTARSLSKLKVLEVIDCTTIECIVLGESEAQDEMLELTHLCSLKLKNLPNLTQLCSLKLKDLPNLKNVFNEEVDPNFEASESHSESTSSSLFDKKVYFPNLKDMVLERIAIEKIWEDQQLSATTWNLTSLVVESCHNLKYLFTILMLRKCLLLLRKLEMSFCVNMEEIIHTEEGFAVLSMQDKILVFPQLESLRLSCLRDQLSSFCKGYFVEFQSLKELRLEAVKFTSFVSKAACAEEAIQEETNQSSEIESLFNEMVSFPNLEVMHLSQVDHIGSIWNNQLAADSFSKLKSLSVNYCPALSSIFPSNMLGRFLRLGKLVLRSCPSVLEVYQLQGLDDDVTLVFELRDLYIEGMFLLKHIWSKDTPQGVVSFQNLQSIDVDECENLKNLFPASIARDLPKLEKLTLRRCGVEEIVGKADEAAAPCFKFPQLSCFLFVSLRKLTSFYPGIHTSEWPNLKSLEVYDCHNVMKFDSWGHALFLLEKVNPDLEILALDDKDLMLIERSGLFPIEHFSNLKVLKLYDLRDEGRIFLKRLHNVDKLHVFSGPIQEDIFSHEVLSGEEQIVFVKHLELSHLQYLKHIWKQDYRLKPLLDYLQTLTVGSCNSLIDIAPSSSSSFKNLSTLNVYHCDRLINLVTVSTAKTMMRLTKLRVYECENMTEIVANDEGDQTQYEIIFSKLKSLELSYLSSLASFCSGNHIFSFPSLEQVIVYGCSKMKFFSSGALSTPKLRRIQLSNANDEQEWEGNLNATISSLAIRRKAASRTRIDLENL